MARVASIALVLALALCALAPATAQTITSLTLSGGSTTRTRGVQYSVTWTTSGTITGVRLRVCSSNSNCGTEYASMTLANTSPYSYTMGNFPDGGYFLEMAPTNALTNTRYSSSFSVAAVTSSFGPISSTSMTRGSTSDITWTVTAGTIRTVNITLLLSGAVVAQIATRVDSTAIAPSFSYDVPATLANNYLYQVRIDAAEYDAVHNPTTRTSSYFSVAAATSSIAIDAVGTTTRGSIKVISWTVVGTIRTVNITLLLNGAVVAQIATRADSTAIAPSFSYDVPATLANNFLYQVRITAVDYDASHDPTTRTSSYFTVVPATATISGITVTNGMVRGEMKSISWTSTGGIYAVNITLLRSGTVVRTVAVNTANTNQFDYSVPETLEESNLYQVRIASSSYSPALDPIVSTSSYFSVESPDSTITIISPTSSTKGGVSYGLLINISCTGFVTGFDVEYMGSSTTVAIATNLTGTLGADRRTVTATTTWIVPASIEPTSIGRIRVRGSIYSAALATPPSTTSSYFSVLSASDYAKQGGGGNNSGDSGSGGGGGGGGAAIGIIITIVALGGLYGFYKKRKEQAAERDMQKMQGINESGQAVAAPLPEDQYVTEGIPMCYFNQVQTAAPPQPDTLVQPVLIPVSPTAPGSPSTNERTGLIAS